MSWENVLKKCIGERLCKKCLGKMYWTISWHQLLEKMSCANVLKMPWTNVLGKGFANMSWKNVLNKWLDFLKKCLAEMSWKMSGVDSSKKKNKSWEYVIKSWGGSRFSLACTWCALVSKLVRLVPTWKPKKNLKVTPTSFDN